MNFDSINKLILEGTILNEIMNLLSEVGPVGLTQISSEYDLYEKYVQIRNPWCDKRRHNKKIKTSSTKCSSQPIRQT